MGIAHISKTIYQRITRYWRNLRNRRVFHTPDEIAHIILLETSMEDKAYIRSACICAEDMVIFHDSVGRTIRNRFHLWDSDNPYTDINEPLLHPDVISHLILEKVWKSINIGE